MKGDVEVKIQNVVAVAALNQRIDLMSIVKTFRNAEWKPKRFPGLVFKYRQPKTATLIFGSGKMVCTGAKSAKQAWDTVKKVMRELKEAGIITLSSTVTVTITNVVASGDLDCEVDLEKIVMALDNTIYEPDQFPGAIYRMPEPKVVILIFRSGKIVITGAKNKEQIHEAANKLRNTLKDKELFFTRPRPTLRAK